MAIICLLHPGAMGASLGGALVDAGHTVRWVSEGRSPATSARADDAGLLAVPDLGAALVDADVVLSVCPPARALDVATEVAAHGFSGQYLDANAIAPATMHEVSAVVSAAGAEPLDGGIVGPPARRPGTTRMFLSGEGARTAEELFAGSILDTVIVGDRIGAASASKVAFAAWTKGSSALLLAVAAYAEAEGVGDALRAEWALGHSGLDARLARIASMNGPKAWRFAGELTESGRAFADAGLPNGFGTAAADVFDRLASLRDRDEVTADEVMALLLPDRTIAGGWGASASDQPPKGWSRVRRAIKRRR